jgi:hypothetical protein
MKIPTFGLVFFCTRRSPDSYLSLGASDGPVKRAIFGENSARLYNFTAAQRAALKTDKVALAKMNYDQHGDGRTNLRYGYMQA